MAGLSADAVVLGVDLGTTFTSAARWVDGRAESVPLGVRSLALPSTVFVNDDGSFLVGEAAEARGVSQPQRLAREFKRRLGDPTPLVLGGTPYSPERLTTMLLTEVVHRAAQRVGRRADALVVTHPASYSSYRLELLRGAVAQVDVPSVSLLPEPVAAAVEYAGTTAIRPGEIIVVYDLGGGTFDVAAVRRGDAGFELLGSALGLDRLGGVDIDGALVELIDQRLDGALASLNPTDAANGAALVRLRGEVRRAKELLSEDTEVTVPIGIVGCPPTVVLERLDVERAIAPRLGETLALVRKVVESADFSLDDVSRVLMVGGSTRIPLVRNTVAVQLARPIAVDVDAEHAVALGAARWAARQSSAPPRGGSAPPGLAAPAIPPRPTPTSSAGTRVSRRRMLTLTGGAVAAAAAGFGVVGVLGSRGEDAPGTAPGDGGSSLATDAITEPSTTPASASSPGTGTPSSTFSVPASDLVLAGYVSVRGTPGRVWVQRGEEGSFLDLDGEVVEAAVAPDGGRLAVVRRVDGRRQLALVDLVAGPLSAVPVDAPGESSGPAWRPDGVVLAFASTDASSSNLYAHDLSTGVTSVLERSASTDRHPAWSPDGRRVSFASDRLGPTQLFVLDVPSGSVTALGDGAPAGRSTWMVDGASVVVESEFGGSSDLAEVFLDGRPVRRVTSSPDDERNPAALDNQRGVLVSVGDAAGAYLAMVSVDDGSMVRVTEPGTGDVAAAPLTAAQVDALG